MYNSCLTTHQNGKSASDTSGHDANTADVLTIDAREQQRPFSPNEMSFNSGEDWKHYSGPFERKGVCTKKKDRRYLEGPESRMHKADNDWIEKVWIATLLYELH